MAYRQDNLPSCKKLNLFNWTTDQVMPISILRCSLYNLSMNAPALLSSVLMLVTKYAHLATQILDLCILSGCDYLPSMKGMGLIKAHKHMQRHRTVPKVPGYAQRVLSLRPILNQQCLSPYRRFCVPYGSPRPSQCLPRTKPTTRKRG